MKEPSRIFLVDDDHQIVRFSKKLSEASGYVVTATTSSKQALALIGNGPPDLLILDLNMPEPDGFELLKALRAQFPYLRILAISGYSPGALKEGVLLEAAQILGAVATLQKPVAADTLVATVRQVLGKSAPIPEPSA